MNALTPQARVAEPWPYMGTPEECAALFGKKLLSAALGYAAKCYPVFPSLMIDGQKKPLVKWGKGEDGHPNLTKRRATTDPETVKAWWARSALAMIGMPTGKPSGVVVLEIDRKNGVDGLANLKAVGIDPYALSPVISITPSGGLHVFMRYNAPTNREPNANVSKVDLSGAKKNPGAAATASGVDIKSEAITLRRQNTPKSDLCATFVWCKASGFVERFRGYPRGVAV